MRKFLLGLLVVILVIGALGVTAYAGYRYGFRQGALAASGGDLQLFQRGFGMNPNRMPRHEFGFQRGFERGGFGMMQRGFGFGFFPGLGFLAQLLFWGLILGGIYYLIARSGWRLTRTTPVVTTPPASPAPPPAPTEEERPVDNP